MGDSDSEKRDRSRRGDRNSRFDNDNRDKSRDRDRGESRRIYISNIPYEYRWQDLKDLFRREVGDVAFVELFSDENNKPRGCGIVEFEKSESVDKALEKMNRYDLNGRNLVIKEDYGNERDKYGRVIKSGGGGGGLGGSGGGLGGGNRDSGRSNDNYGRRDRDDNDRMSYNDRSGGDQSYNTYGLSTKFLEGLGISGPLHTKVFVANLDYKVDAKKLKQVFKLAGRIYSLDLSVDKDGNSRGFAVIEYEHPVEAVQAISMFDRQILFDRRMTVRLDRVPEKSEGIKLPDGLKGIGIGLGPNGEPLRDVARNLPSAQSNSNTASSNNASNNTLSSLSSQLGLGNQGNSAPTPVAPPLTGASSILGPVPNNSLSGLSNNLAALSNVVGLSGLANPLLSTAASLSNLGLNLGVGGNDLGGSNQNASNSNQSSFNAYNTTGFNSRNDFDLGGVRNYNTQSNDDYNSRNFGNGTRNGPSDTIIVRNLPPSWTWQNLRDKFRDVGEVKFAEIRGSDTGVVRFAKERDAEVAIKLMDGSRFDGRTVDVTFF